MCELPTDLYISFKTSCAQIPIVYHDDSHGLLSISTTQGRRNETALSRFLSMSIVNPSAPQAYLPPDLALGYEAQSHVFFLVLGVSSPRAESCSTLIVTCQAWLWDFINAIPEEYATVWKRKPNVATVVYIISRLEIHPKCSG